MTIHIDPNADIIQQLNDLSEIITTRNVTVMVSDYQYQKVISKAWGWTCCTLPTFIIKAGASEVNITIIQGNIVYELTEDSLPQHFSGNRIRTTTPPTPARPDAASSEGHTHK